MEHYNPARLARSYDVPNNPKPPWVHPAIVCDDHNADVAQSARIMFKGDGPSCFRVPSQLVGMSVSDRALLEPEFAPILYHMAIKLIPVWLPERAQDLVRQIIESFDWRVCPSEQAAFQLYLKDYVDCPDTDNINGAANCRARGNGIPSYLVFLALWLFYCTTDFDVKAIMLPCLTRTNLTFYLFRGVAVDSKCL
ncbi:hypothetical protein P8C59_004413 [Phyllachora maydis]|nr:hypothetical protein P8C59_004413 [Phyllachora maydis]